MTQVQYYCINTFFTSGVEVIDLPPKAWNLDRAETEDQTSSYWSPNKVMKVAWPFSMQCSWKRAFRVLVYTLNFHFYWSDKKITKTGAACTFICRPTVCFVLHLLLFGHILPSSSGIFPNDIQVPSSQQLKKVFHQRVASWYSN